MEAITAIVPESRVQNLYRHAWEQAQRAQEAREMSFASDSKSMAEYCQRTLGFANGFAMAIMFAVGNEENWYLDY